MDQQEVSAFFQAILAVFVLVKVVVTFVLANVYVLMADQIPGLTVVYSPKYSVIQEKTYTIK